MIVLPDRELGFMSTIAMFLFFKLRNEEAANGSFYWIGKNSPGFVENVAGFSSVLFLKKLFHF